MASVFDKEFDEAMIGRPPYERLFQSTREYCPVCGEELPPSLCFKRRHLIRCYAFAEIVKKLVARWKRRQEREACVRYSLTFWEIVPAEVFDRCLERLWMLI